MVLRCFVWVNHPCHSRRILAGIQLLTIYFPQDARNYTIHEIFLLLSGFKDKVRNLTVSDPPGYVSLETRRERL